MMMMVMMFTYRLQHGKGFHNPNPTSQKGMSTKMYPYH
jgi:hypothetical protein